MTSDLVRTNDEFKDAVHMYQVAWDNAEGNKKQKKMAARVKKDENVVRKKKWLQEAELDWYQVA